MSATENAVLSAIAELRRDIVNTAAQRDDALLTKIDEIYATITARLDELEDRVYGIESECLVRKDVYLGSKEFLSKPRPPFSDTVSLYAGRGILIVIGGAVMTYVYEVVKLIAKSTTRQ